MVMPEGQLVTTISAPGTDFSFGSDGGGGFCVRLELVGEILGDRS